METNNEMARRVLDAVRGNDAALQQVSKALLSQDEEQIRTAFAQVAGVQLTDEQVQTLVENYSSEDKLAAST